MRMKRKPTTPGEMLKEEFLIPLKLTQKNLADHIGCDVKDIHQLVNNKGPISAILALKLASTFNTTPDFWLNLQRAVDLYQAHQELTDQSQSVPAPIVDLYKGHSI